jgi:hypothetical protein
VQLRDWRFQSESATCAPVIAARSAISIAGCRPNPLVGRVHARRRLGADSGAISVREREVGSGDRSCEIGDFNRGLVASPSAGCEIGDSADATASLAVARSAISVRAREVGSGDRSCEIGDFNRGLVALTVGRLRDRRFSRCDRFARCSEIGDFSPSARGALGDRSCEIGGDFNRGLALRVPLVGRVTRADVSAPTAARCSPTLRHARSAHLTRGEIRRFQSESSRCAPAQFARSAQSRAVAFSSTSLAASARSAISVQVRSGCGCEIGDLNRELSPSRRQAAHLRRDRRFQSESSRILCDRFALCCEIGDLSSRARRALQSVCDRFARCCEIRDFDHRGCRPRRPAAEVRAESAWARLLASTAGNSGSRARSFQSIFDFADLFLGWTPVACKRCLHELRGTS